jgi:YHS domain-containing protein
MLTLISRRVMIAAAVFLAAVPAIAAEPSIYLGKGWQAALNGHDAVAYYSLAEGAAPVKGSAEFSTTYEGATWWFSNAANRDAFAAEPAKYAPKYGNYCAWALARNKLAPGDPAVWYVKDGALYLNVNKSIQKQWLANIDRDIANAEKNWPGVLGGKPTKTSTPSGS